jgi:hypothetical protein
MSSQQTTAADHEPPGAARFRLGRQFRKPFAFRHWAFTEAARPYWSVFLALLSGAALRLFFILVHPKYVGDTGVYGTIAKNILLHRGYALNDPFHFTLIRLPGYPLYLAAIFEIFGMDNYNAARGIQGVTDLASCLLIAGFVRDHATGRAAQWALWLAALCPFTANYTAVPMTETNSIFCVALGLFASGRLIAVVRSRERIPWRWLSLTALALSCAILLRPDGVLLPAAIVPGIWWYTRKEAARLSWRAGALCGLLVVLSLVPWAVRNYRVFHVFQPLAPRYATDPGEDPLRGYVRWTKTWLAEYVSSPEVYWRGDSIAIDAHMLPSRAFDSPEEYRQTEKLISDYNENTTITPEVDARFAALAEQRVSRHPFRYYVVLPLARLTDMALRPRTELLTDALPLRWWEWSEHPGGSLLAICYGLLNAALLAAAAMGFIRRRVPFAAMLGSYILLRCALLATMENAEPRYTLEWFPMLIVAAAAAMTPNNPHG